MEKIKYAFFISDAGSSNQILHLILNENLDAEIFGHEPGFSLARSLGMAVKKFDEFDSESEFDVYVFGSYLINHEQDSLLETLILKQVKTVGMVDHWINYDIRWANLQTSEIWVSDNFAYSLAIQYFPSSQIVLKTNHYFNNIEIEYKVLKSKNFGNSIGFLGKRSNHNIEFGNEDILISNCFCNYIGELIEDIGQDQILYREHPSNFHNECFEFLKKKYPTINILNASDLSLAEFLSRNRRIYGELTYALYISQELGIETFCLEKLPTDWKGPNFHVHGKFI